MMIAGCSSPPPKFTQVTCANTRTLHLRIGDAVIKTPNIRRESGSIFAHSSNKDDLIEIPVRYRWKHPTILSHCQRDQNTPIDAQDVGMALELNALRPGSPIYNGVSLAASRYASALPRGSTILKEPMQLAVLRNQRSLRSIPIRNVDGIVIPTTSQYVQCVDNTVNPSYPSSSENCFFKYQFSNNSEAHIRFIAAKSDADHSIRTSVIDAVNLLGHVDKGQPQQC